MGCHHVSGLEGTLAGLTGRPRLLFLCQTLPYPPDGGVWIRTYHVLRLLAREFDVTALCFERARTSVHGAAHDIVRGREGLSPLAAVEVFALPHKHSRVRFAWDHWRSAMFGRVYTRYVYDSRPFQRRLRELLQSRDFALVHVDSLDLARYLPACRGIPVVCVHHDIESHLLRRRAALDRQRWRRAYFRYQSGLMDAIESRHCERVALNVTCSEHDRSLLLARSPRSRVVVVPNGVDVDTFQPVEGDGSGVAYVGGTTPFPNRDALDFFCDEILPRLRTAGAHGPIRWIGSASPEEQQIYRERYGMNLTGYVDDVRPLMGDAACHVVPLRTGGGTRLKILNAWAMGKAVVSTSVGCEGLAAVDGQNILIRNHPGEFADAVLQVLGNAQLRRDLGARGRTTAERFYSWDAIGRPMLETYLAIASGHNQISSTADSAVARRAHA
jgi:glycosyltransferase involved in cell wall biosynthesis